MESIMKDEVGESSSNSRLSNDNNGDNKAVVVRVKRKLDQSPLEAFWLEINEIPVKRPLIDFQKLSISDSSTQEELKIKRVLVEHVETVSSAKASIHFLQSFVPPTPDGDSKFKASTKERRRTLQKENKHDQLLSKAKQEQEEIARGARFEQIWKHRTHNKKAIHDEALNEVCRVYDVLRVDKAEETSKMINKQEEMSVEEQEILSKFLPLLRECVPGAAEEIESDIVSSASRHAEDHPANDYPEEESSDEEKSSKSGSDSEEESEAESDMSEKSEDSIGFDQAEDPLYEDEMNESHDNADSYDDGDDEDWR
uniref:Uncharacterized protein n=1 Tax=Chenopodium quinoa TaxID=63459 RepID=A0A803LCX7_CHEQI